MRKILLREEHEFNRKVRDKNHDPSSLKNFCMDVTNGYTGISKFE